MATSSITKNFIIKDEKTCRILADALAARPERKPEKSSTKYEEGKKKLVQYFGR